MDKKSILKTLKSLKEQSKSRKFSQTIDLIITLKGLNMKNPQHHVDFFTTLHHDIGKKKKICALVGPELADKAKGVFDHVIVSGDFSNYKEKKLVKSLAKKHEYFVAQADVMPKVAATFGRALGPRGKMPNPKAGQIIPPKASVEPVYEKLQKTVRIMAKKQLAIQVAVGTEKLDEAAVADNIQYIYNQLIHNLPQEKNNIKSVYLKLTMGKPIVVE